MATKDILALRYSEALYIATGTEKLRQEVEADFNEIADIIDAKFSGSKLMLSKVVPMRVKLKLWDRILSKSKLNKITSNFLRILIEHNRLYCLPSIIYHFKNKLLESKGVLIAYVTTAVALNEKEVKSLAKELSTIFKKSVKVENKVKKRILGGIIVRVGSSMIDCSLSTKLQEIKQTMKSARI